ncbi:MAG TPA: hypothetical protein ENK16_00275 [Chromatiales bacterium]|nr:hypothetical protein [Chromatiales bacterium]
MNVLLGLSFLVACALSAGIGALVMRGMIRRRQEIADREDSRDTQIRELLAALKVARTDAKRAREQAAETTSVMAQSKTEFETTRQALEAAQQQHEETRQLLQSEIDQKSALRDQLEAMRRECETFKSRAQELELELSVSQTKDLLDPKKQLG